MGGKVHIGRGLQRLPDGCLDVLGYEATLQKAEYPIGGNETADPRTALCLLRLLDDPSGWFLRNDPQDFSDLSR
jgi:hypothetical protein